LPKRDKKTKHFDVMEIVETIPNRTGWIDFADICSEGTYLKFISGFAVHCFLGQETSLDIINFVSIYPGA